MNEVNDCHRFIKDYCRCHDQKEGRNTSYSEKTKKCTFYEDNGFCKFGDSCHNIHPKKLCKNFVGSRDDKAGIFCKYFLSLKD